MARRRNKIAFPRVNSKTVIMGGGINEAITNLELKPGELFECLNYEEIDGVYHGYSSVEGIERFDGRPSPSDVSVQFLQDDGNNGNTQILIESADQNDYNDKSQNNYSTTPGTVIFDSSRSKYGLGSWRITTATSGITVDQSSGFNFNTTEWSIDGWFQFTSDTANTVIFEKTGVVKMVIESTDLKVYLSTDVSGVDGVVITYPGLSSNRWNEFKIVKDGDNIYVGTNGNMLAPVSISGEVILDNTNDFIVGNPTGSTSSFYIDSLRVSDMKLAVNDYDYQEQVAYSDDQYFVFNVDDLAREAARSLITEVPGEDTIRGVHIFEGDGYAVRDKIGIAEGALYKESASGWTEVSTVGLFEVDYITGSMTSLDAGDTFTASGGATGSIQQVVIETGNPASGSAIGYLGLIITSGTVGSGETITADTSGNTVITFEAATSEAVGVGSPANFVTGRFALFPQSDPNSNAFYFTSGTTGVFASNGTNIYHIQGPEDVNKVPVTLAIFSDRLWLAYEDGHIFYSAPGEPDNFSTELGAGEIYLGGDITNLTNLPGGALAVIGRNKITIIKQVGSATAPTDYFYTTEDFSKRSGGYFNTAQRILGDIFFADDRGLTSMKAVDTWGDFETGAIQKRAQITYQEDKNNTSGAVVHRAKNQYRLFFNLGGETECIFYTFTDKQLKGTTIVNYPVGLSCFAEGEDANGNIKLLAGSDNGFVYLMDKGVSFDGAEIPTKLTTAFYHYATPRLWKRFYRVLFEITADNNMVFNVKPEFNYRSSVMASARTTNPEITGKGGVWGLDKWGQFIWSGSAVNTVMVYLNGYGYNMGISLTTSDKYRDAHIIHNMITDYANGNMQM